MVGVKRIRAPSDIPAEGGYVLVLYGPSAIDREHPRGRTLMVRDGKKVKLDEFAAAVETAKNLSETEHFQTVYEKWLKLRKEPRYRLEHDRFLQRKEPIQHIL
jgi:hypothetical protein